VSPSGARAWAPVIGMTSAVSTASSSSAQCSSPASTAHDRTTSKISELQIADDDEDGAIILGLIKEEFVESEEEADEEEEEEPEHNAEIMDSIVYVDETFDEDFDDPLEILPELQRITSGTESLVKVEPPSCSAIEQVSQPASVADSDARTTSTSPGPVDDRSIDDLRSVPEDEGAPSEPAAEEEGPQTTTVAVQALYNLPESGREEVEEELASLGVLIQEGTDHRRIMLVEQVEVTGDVSDSDSENEEAVVLTAAPAGDTVAHTRAQASIWLGISKYWSGGSRPRAGAGCSSDEPSPPRPTRRERSRSNSPDHHRADYLNAINGALQMALHSRK